MSKSNPALEVLVGPHQMTLIHEQGVFESHGHRDFCAVWADLWETHWGRENLDVGTLDHLEDCRKQPAWCLECLQHNEVKGQ